ncbi:MAG: type II toxin-antitoxin system Phd/YefM family antitoxin [Verrucomicrobia bacterium]|nr:type II toxin-antitoxin system Phd/YefM family antitoxin [Verrucomicrobiota bacterium]MBU4290635.1 type II toxin-antitoxin system Phd/YefM family antitoxin [Verrucomicrobiota bacterium]MBU4429608.1 type II toxin-antitoxin system Phd/YefM family antitoxin [Verrucomicrobiota bacterium]MCG2678592.1 type II toxin-antitoxin system Phd/YefM family antitoxin [Kiritimatiellia bacterium]
MKTIQIGAFDAKTHFSQLLQDVIKGKTFEILRRGKPVAHLTSVRVTDNFHAAREALDYLRNLRRTISVSRAEVRGWINEGRS